MKITIRISVCLIMLSVLCFSVQAQPLNADILQGDTIYVCPSHTQTLNCNATYGSAPYNYVWTGGGGQLTAANTPTASFLASTTPSASVVVCTVTDGLGGTATDSIVVIVPGIPILNPGPPQTICLGSSATLIASGGIAYQWSTGESTPTITVSPTADAMYGVTITYPYGCVDSAVYIVLIGSSLNVSCGSDQTICLGNSAQLTGSGVTNYFWSPSTGLSSTTGATVYASPSTTTTYTLLGADQIGCTGTCAVTVTVNNCADTITGKVFFDTNNDGIQNSGESGTSHFMVRCDSSNSFVFPDSMGYYKMNVPMSQLTITIPNLPLAYVCTPVSHAANFTMLGQVDSLNDFAIYPLPNVNDLGVSLSSLPANPAAVNHLFINYKNQGAASINATITLICDSLYTYYSSTPSCSSITGDTIRWNINNIMPLSCGSISVEAFLPISTTMGTPLISIAMITPIIGDTMPADNVDSLYQVTVASYDPNDKSVVPSEPLTSTQVLNASPLTYTIRFQNTGTAAAINIRIEDSICSNLNFGSLEMIASSHAYTLQCPSPGVLEWTFHDINLPDSGANEALSHGYIKYRICPVTTMGEEDTINNTAYIYFDFNPAVVTNTAVSYLEDVSIHVAEMDVDEPVKLFPNPANNELTVVSGLPGECQLDLFNVYGTMTLSKHLESGVPQQKISITGLDCGIYFYVIRDLRGNRLQSGKLVVMR
jgi:uncharacterized repeat protein (TIGR01451 family)